MLKNLKKELEAYGKNVVSKARQNLRKNDNTGTLSSSLTYEVKEDKDVNIIFYGEDYGNFLDKGVQGNDPQAMPRGSKSRFNKAPNSPYQFGSGLGRTGLRNSIDKWVLQRGGFKVRDDKGRFIKRSSLVYLISRSIWYTGLRATNFFTDAQNTYNKTLTDKLAKGYSKDAAQLIVEDLKEMKNVKVTYGR